MLIEYDNLSGQTFQPVTWRLIKFRISRTYSNVSIEIRSLYIISICNEIEI